MTTTVALWILGPTALFCVWVGYLAVAGHLTRHLQFRSQMETPTPAAGRRGALVNVAVPADRALPAESVQHVHTIQPGDGAQAMRAAELVRPIT